MRTIAFYTTLSLFTAAVLLILLSIRHNTHPAPPSPLPIPAPDSDGWTFSYPRDGHTYSLTRSQCEASFPGLYHEITRAASHRQQTSNITTSDLAYTWRGDGIIRAMIHSNQLYIIAAHGVTDHNHRPRSLATLHSIHRAVVSSPHKLPNVEFTFTDHDSALLDEHGKQTTWSYSRLSHQKTIWLIPDFGYWGWPDVGVRSYADFLRQLDSEPPFPSKIPKLIWRGSLAVGSRDARAGLVQNSADKPWSDVATLDWGNSSDIDAKLLGMQNHCDYMFTAHTEGNTYSGRLKYLLNCESVLVSHRLKWIEHFHHLLRDAGPQQNYFRVERGFGDLEGVMGTLLGDVEAAGRVARRAKEVFRERYLSPAAETCYWRRLFDGWASVQGFEPELRGEGGMLRGTPFESYVIMEATEWEVPPKPRRVCVDE